jgi:hypothetical protein
LFVDSNNVVNTLAHGLDVDTMDFFFFLNTVSIIAATVLTHTIIILLLLSGTCLTPTVSQLQCQSGSDTCILVKKALDSLVLPPERYYSLEYLSLARTQKTVKLRINYETTGGGVICWLLKEETAGCAKERQK